MANRAASAVDTAAAPPKGMSFMTFVVAMLILTAVGGAAGGLLGLELSAKIGKPVSDGGKAQAGADENASQRSYDGARLKSLAPVVTNLASPGRAWIRLESTLVLEAGQSGGEDVLAGQISEDLVAFLRTVSLAQIEGPSGFQHLREDLNDRVRIRGGGKIRELLIETLIIE